MSNVRRQENDLQRFLKVIGSIVAAIILGAIGSGVWERVLSPALSKLSDATASVVSGISSGYEEAIYQRAARDTTDLYPMKIAMLILVLVGVALVVTIALRALAQSNVQERTQRRIHRFFGIQGLSLGLSLVLMAFISMARLDAASQIKESSLRSLEILRPYTGENTYLQLRSEYYSIESKKDFEAFKAKILEQATKAPRKVSLTKGAS
jgi:uncharacterized membrane protein YjgN (DUF898 family)